MLDTMDLSWKVAMRNWAIYRKFLFSNIIPTLADPAFFILSFGIGLGGFVSQIDGMSYTQFMGPGLATSTALMTAFFSTSYNFYVRLFYEGITHAMLTTPVGPREIIFGEFIWVGLKSAGMSMGVVLVLLCFGLVDYHYLWAVPFVSLFVGLACGGMGLISTAMVESINQFQTVYAVVISPIFFFSGVFFPINQFPVVLQWLAHLSPLYHGVVINQQLLWGKPNLFLILTHSLELLVLSMILCFIAYKLIYPKMER